MDARKMLATMAFGITIGTLSWTFPATASNVTPAEQVGLDSNAVSAAYNTFRNQLTSDVNGYTTTSVNLAVASQIAVQAHAIVTPLENLQAAALNVNFTGKKRLDGASLAVIITKYT